MASLRAVLFDVYGTLFDVHGVAQLAETLFAGHGNALSQLWRDKQIEYTRLVTIAGPGGERHRPFSALTRSALRHAAQRLGLRLDAPAEDRLLAAYRCLPAFDDAVDVLDELRRRGVRAGVLSNGEPEMIAAVVRHAGLAARLDPLVSVDAARLYKPHPAAYALGEQALQLPAREILFVSGNAWDAIGATWFGYTTLWVDRAGVPPEALGVAPHHVGRSLRDVLPLLAAAELP